MNTDVPAGKVRGKDGKLHPCDKSTIDYTQIVGLYKSGMSMRAVAHQVGCALGTVANAVRWAEDEVAVENKALNEVETINLLTATFLDPDRLRAWDPRSRRLMLKTLRSAVLIIEEMDKPGADGQTPNN
ncbi:hypothetical protein [Gordonia sp. DT101]|uniref:hypothetical protein n=1 Tax=Gordonia sp. DT101 TaxID=3416545 RepID=UPI003CEAAEBB